MRACHGLVTGGGSGDGGVSIKGQQEPPSLGVFSVLPVAAGTNLGDKIIWNATYMSTIKTGTLEQDRWTVPPLLSRL